MSREIVLISIGPVQGFIATARRCQDLWYGSWLLSELSRVVASVFEDETLVFPGDLRDEAAVANKVLAIVEHGEGEPRAQRVRKALDDRLDEIAKALFDRYERHYQPQVGPRQLGGQTSKLFQRATAEAHIRELIECQSVVVPFDDDYGAARRQAEQLLAARKNTRLWSQVSGTAGVPKSSLDGARESVLHEDIYKKFSPAERRRIFWVKKSERLSGVDLLKRVGLELPSEGEGTSDWRRRVPKVFHSSSHVAALPLLTRVATRGEVGREALQCYLNELEDLGLDLARFEIRAGVQEQTASVARPFGPHQGAREQVPRVFRPSGEGARTWGYDGVLFFESRLEDVFEEALDESHFPQLRERVRKAKRALHSFLKKIDYSGDSTPYAYYAFLQADGDKMGAVLDALAAQKGAIEIHAKLSRHLDAFAREARTLIERHAGSAIYTGGDDVLALLPLHTALDGAEALRDLFREKVAAHVPSDLRAPGGRALAPTLSVGIAIAHHNAPMREARALAKRAEQEAKNGGRNALAIAVAKRSGGTRIVCGSWSETPNLAARIRRWAERLADGEMPHAVGYELEQAARPFETLRPEEQGEATDAIRALAGRALARRRSRDDEEVDKALRDEIDDRVSADDTMASVRRLADEIHIARTFGRAWSVAWDGSGAREESK